MSVASSTDVDTHVVLEALEDLAPPCEYAEHDQLGEGPAVWALWTRRTRPCTCPPERQDPVLMCDPCWIHIREAVLFRCPRCGVVYAAGRWLVRLERI